MKAVIHTIYSLFNLKHYASGTKSTLPNEIKRVMYHLDSIEVMGENVPYAVLAHFSK